MLQKQEIYEVPYGYRAKIGLVVVGPNLNPTPDARHVFTWIRWSMWRNARN
jgi:hypothetical protein